MTTLEHKAAVSREEGKSTMEETRHSIGEQTVEHVKTMVVYRRRDAHPHWRLCGEDWTL